MIRYALAVLAALCATAAQAQFLDDQSAECIAASNAPQVAEADGMTFQSAEARVPRVTWVIWNDTIDFCIRARTYNNRDQAAARREALAVWMGNNVMSIAAAGPYADIALVQVVAAVFEDRVNDRCGDDRSCRAETAQTIVENLGNNQVRFGIFSFNGGNATLIFVRNQLIGGLLEENGSVAEIRFRELQ